MLTESQILLEAATVINDEIKTSFAQQGHTLTGAWENSIYAEANGDEVVGLAKTYGLIVDYGVTADRIPYDGNGGNGGNGGVSKYIQGLYNFWKLRKPGLTDKEALSLAFATAKVQKKEGMSTWASRDYSENKKRQKFIEDAIINTEEQVTGMVFGGMVDIVNESVSEQRELVF